MSGIRMTRRWAVAAATTAAAAVGIALAVPAQAAAPTLTERYTAVGSSHIKSINANLPITKTALTATLNLNNFNIISGTLPIHPQTITFNALGFIPIRGTATLVQTAPITGKLNAPNNGPITVNADVKYTIKLSNIQVSVLGFWQSLQVGNDCQTINPVDIPVATPKGQAFDIAKGGTVAGTYTIGQFKNCAPLNLPDLFGVGSLLVNSLVPGSGNTVTVKLSNGRAVS